VPVQFQLDEHIDHAIAHGLQRRGIDVLTAAEAGLRSVPDSDILAYAFRERRVLLTHDNDFLRLHQEGQSHAGIAFCEAGRKSIGEIIARLVKIFEDFEPDDLTGVVTFL
jgi:predicted nuclease of predicted toxin-antitoxin system